MYKTFQVQVDIDMDDYERNYGTRDDADAIEHTRATIEATITQAFDSTGGWASVIGDGVQVR